MLMALVAVVGAAVAVWYFVTKPVLVAAPARNGRAVEAVYATAVVEPVHWGRVGPIAVGRIAEIRVREGDKVTRGQELARMNGAASHLGLAHSIWGQVLRPGSVVVDATCGNGHGALAIAKCVFSCVCW